LGAEVGSDLRAAKRVPVARDLRHRAKADRTGRERPPEQRGRFGMRTCGQLDAAVDVLHLNLLL
jgi:hypothetical protein